MNGDRFIVGWKKALIYLRIALHVACQAAGSDLLNLARGHKGS